jgi:hypothetical protein
MSAFHVEVFMRKKTQHVVPRDGGWAIKGAGSKKATKVFSTQSEAIQAGRDIARRQGSELLIHGRDGRIRKKDSYGKDPFPPKG